MQFVVKVFGITNRIYDYIEVLEDIWKIYNICFYNIYKMDLIFVKIF